MRIFTFSDLYTQRQIPFSKEINDYLTTIDNPYRFVESLIKKEMKGHGFSFADKATTTDKIMNYIKTHNIITTRIAKQEGLIHQSNQLHQAITILTKAKHKIYCISDKRPFIYYYEISKDEALKRMKKEPRKTHRGPNVSYSTEGMRGL